MTAENHPSTDEFLQILRREYSNISFDTVIRTLISFTQIRLFTVAELYKKSRRFDPNVEYHHHIHCLKCGRIFSFMSEEFDQLMPSKQLMQKCAAVLYSRLIFNGISLDCHNKDY